MIPQTWVQLTDETDLKNIQKTLDLLEEDDDVQEVYHNWEEQTVSDMRRNVYEQ